MTSTLVRCLGAATLLLGLGCGVSAPEISVAASCTLESVPVLVEEGVTLGSSPAASCATSSEILGKYRATFEEGWGGVALRDEGWTIRVRAGGTVDSEGHTGVTYHYSRIVDVAERAFETFPHELRHVQLGRSSDDHHGWCSSFSPWEQRVLGVDERAYLGCPH